MSHLGGGLARVVACVVMTGLAGCGGDSASPTVEPEPSGSPAAIDARCEVDPAVFPEFESQAEHPITFHDQTGLTIGCRRVGFEEQTSIIETFGPPLPPAMTRGSVHVRRADTDGTRLLVMWVVAGCDGEARIVASRSAAGSLVTVTQRVTGRCAPGTGLTAVEIAFSEEASLEDLSASLVHDRASPSA